MALPLLFQFSIALLTGMVAATFVPPVRKAIPRPVEVLLWAALIVVCALGLISVNDAEARNLTTSVIWGTDRVINTIVGLLLGGVAGWIMDNRFVIATWLAIVAGVDVLALILVRSIRKARGWEPRVRLREWMEIPVPVKPPAQARVVPTDPLVDLNRRIAAAGAVLDAAMLAKRVDLSIWLRNVVLPRQARRLANAAQAGRAGSRAGMESLRDSAAHLEFAARAWYTAAGEPAINGLTARAGDAVRTARTPGKTLRPGQVIDIQALLSAQSIGWYGPLTAGPAAQPRGETDADQPQKTDRLAS
ncbi:MAG TPA: hypothetical protein VGR23_03235 [Candidatus Dormibacteraeota bacterium]|nr:hypothetical protein [Candidatus Dormibacteraeota bacterium]